MLIILLLYALLAYWMDLIHFRKYNCTLYGYLFFKLKLLNTYLYTYIPYTCIKYARVRYAKSIRATIEVIKQLYVCYMFWTYNYRDICAMLYLKRE